MSKQADAVTSVESLKQRVNRFAVEREWLPFHSLKNLSMALAVEAAELMEPFQWLGEAEEKRLMADARRRQAVEEELADVLLYALQFANRAEIDVAGAIERKMLANARKYPVDRVRGRADVAVEPRKE